jgi:hypothetical protein
MTDIDFGIDYDEQEEPVQQEEAFSLERYGERAGAKVAEAIHAAATGSDRSQQSRELRIGVSNLGSCRQYVKYMTEQVQPEQEEQGNFTAAFVGTVLGDAIEKQIQKMHPDWLTQTTLTFTLPQGGEIPGHADIIIPFSAGTKMEDYDPENPDHFIQGVWDLKSKAELDTIKRIGPNLQQKYQIHAYTAAAIDAGHLNPDFPIVLGDVFFDRSARDNNPYGVFYLYDPSVIEEIDEWIGDVLYAVKNNEDAPRDKSRDFCERFCEYNSICRGTDTDVEGLLEDPSIVGAVQTYLDGMAMESQGKRLKDNAKEALRGISGSTGTHTVREVVINPTEIAAYTRAGYTKIDIRKVPQAKKK